MSNIKFCPTLSTINILLNLEYEDRGELKHPHFIDCNLRPLTTPLGILRMEYTFVCTPIIKNICTMGGIIAKKQSLPGNL